MSEPTNKAYAKVYKSGNGQVISIKKDMLEKAGFKIGDELVMNVKGNQIVLEKPNTFKDRWGKFIEDGGEYERGEYDWGESVGREEW